METGKALTALAALTQESRLSIFRMLVKRGPSGMAATKIAEDLGVPASSLSFHLKELTDAGLINLWRNGRYIIYAANFDTINTLIFFLTENCCSGSPCSPMLQERTADSTLF